MKENVALSVIVPIYNLETCLPKCLDSILSQTFHDFEMILVDDGSEDGSLSVCKKYQEKDNRIRVFHQENGGVSSARNFGLDHICGRYVSFVDGDDLIEPDMYGRLMDELIRSNADIACCQLDRITPEGKHIVAYPAACEVCSADSIVSRFFDEGYIKECMYGPYNKVFRAECIGDTRFKPYKYGEDLLFVFETLRNAKAVCIDDYVGYHYVERPGSAVKSGFSLSKLDYLKAAREVERLCGQHFVSYAERAHRWVYRHALITVRQLIQHGMAASQKDYIDAERRYLKANVACISELPFRFRMNYYLVMYLPFLLKGILQIKKLLNM